VTRQGKRIPPETPDFEPIDGRFGPALLLRAG
jgi:hypothetical protein